MADTIRFWRGQSALGVGQYEWLLHGYMFVNKVIQTAKERFCHLV